MTDDIASSSIVLPSIPISADELEEICRCYHCDCSTYPVCTWQGEPCAECFHTETMTHLDPQDSSPGKYHKKRGGNNQQIIPRPLTKTYIEEIFTRPNGDCLYECIALALNEYLDDRRATYRITVDDLRAYVSRCQTNQTFEAYQALARHQSEYRALVNVRSLRGLKNVIRQTGTTVGPEHCLWGDENCLNIFSEGYKLRFAVFDEKGVLVQTIGNERYPHTILLRHNRSHAGEEHFTLLKFNDQTVLQRNEWNWLEKRMKK